ncbi:hypothetical protein T02_11290 [Trichinella nativa]|uniref:Uncharacterized protein n=1 Tax=Trichinella nativa TaxID=6335 RepID=A0A0V1LLT0_9BILA|nr:hypothetical protein T02_12290 [Trichinella nativa]KRZ60438.1 hypothetical protein T02_11290 [Trichinella nativa]
MQSRCVRTRSCGTFRRWDNVEGSLSGDSDAGAADPRRSSEAGHQDNPGGRRLPGETAAARRHREAREDRDGLADRRHDKSDAQESRAAGTNDATTPAGRCKWNHMCASSKH